MTVPDLNRCLLVSYLACLDVYNRTQRAIRGLECSSTLQIYELLVASAPSLDIKDLLDNENWLSISVSEMRRMKSLHHYY